MVGDASPEHFEELATHLPNLTVAQLKDIRAALGISNKDRTKQAIVARLVNHAGRVVSGELPASQDRPEPVPKAPRPPKPGAVKTVPPGELHVDPARFQFKLNTNNPAGVTDELKSVKTWNPDLAGVISVWRDPKDGQTYVVNGHHRHALATRLGSKDLAVRYIDAADSKEARAVGALVNIAEGRGTAIDAAKFMRDKGLSIDDFAKYGVTLKAGALADQAQTLTKLNPRAFHRLSLGQLDVNKALAVAKHLENPERQEKLFKLLDKRREEGKDIGTKTVEEMARTMNAVKDATTTTSTLWGPEENSEDTFVHRAVLAQAIRAELASDVTDFEVVASERRAGKISGAGNVLAVGENKQRADAAEKAKNVFDALANRSGPVADALNDGAVKLAQAKTDKERKRARFETGEAVREAIDRELGTADRGAKSPAIPASAEPGEPADVGAADAGRGEAEPGGLTPPAKAAIVAKLVQHAAEKAKGETSKESSKPDASSDGYTTTPDAKPLHQMTIGEALESGVDYHDWHNAVTDAFRNEVTAEDDPIFHSLPKDLQTGTDYKRAQKLMGQQVIDSKGNEHTLTDIAPDLSHVILTDKAGKQAAYRMDDVHSVAGYVDHYIEGAKDGSLHPSNAERIAPHLAKEIVASGENMFTALKQRGVDPMSRGGKVLRDAVARQIEKIQAEKNKPSPERQRAMSRAVELQTAPEPTSVVDPSHEQDVQRGREADKKFRGDGRYESEIWQNLKRKNPGKPLPKLSKDAAEWTADEYERDGKPVPPEVLADYPDLAAKYAPKPATPESPPRAVEAKDDAARMERALDAMRRAGNPEEAAPAPVAATSAPAAPAPTPVASMSPKEFADAVHQIANAETRGYGNNKVFISDVFDGLKKRDPSLTLGEFKRRLLDAHGDRDLGLTLSRADLAQVMHPDDVSRSEIVHPHFSGVNFHFVQTPEQKPRTNRGPDGGIHSNPASVPSAPAPPPAAAFSASPTR